MVKKTAETKSKRRTKLKPMSKPATELGSKQAKKVRGGDGASSLQGWLLISKQQPLW